MSELYLTPSGQLWFGSETAAAICKLQFKSKCTFRKNPYFALRFIPLTIHIFHSFIFVSYMVIH